MTEDEVAVGFVTAVETMIWKIRKVRGDVEETGCARRYPDKIMCSEKPLLSAGQVRLDTKTFSSNSHVTPCTHFQIIKKTHLSTRVSCVAIIERHFVYANIIIAAASRAA